MIAPIAATGRRPRRRLRTLLSAALIPGLLISVSLAGTVKAASTLNVGVGVGTGTVSGNVYLPGDLTILIGDSVKWTVESDEPHSITFGNGPAGTPPPFWPAAGFTGTVAPPPAITNLTASYNGAGFLNTELLFTGSSATVTFTTAGTFPFLCQIHPGMAGTVNVLAAGTATTQAEADAKAGLTRAAILGAVDGLTAATLAEVSETERADGTSLWNIFANAQQDPAPQPGGGTGFLELLRFLPPSLQIGAGDTVKWTAFAPHTVTFPAAGQDPMTIDPFTAPATTNAVYDGSSLYNSSLLALGPGTPDTYELTFPTAGTFNYVCALHQFLGQTGTIVVLAAPAATPTPATTLPPTDTSGISSGAPSQGVPWLVIGLLTIFALSVATGTALLRRRR